MSMHSRTISWLLFHKHKTNNLIKYTVFDRDSFQRNTFDIKSKGASLIPSMKCQQTSVFGVAAGFDRVNETVALTMFDRLGKTQTDVCVVRIKTPWL